MFRESASRLVFAARSAAARACVVNAVRAIYRFTDVVVASRQPICRQCARCCQFERHGHSLFVSTAEVAFFLHTTTPDRIRTVAEGACPFLRPHPARCAARAARPLGCRVYHCDGRARWWQQDLYNHLHARLRDLHRSFGIDYLYAEWLSVLRDMESH